MNDTLANRGQNQIALDTFNKCAQQGNADCMHNIGWMWQGGRINGDDRMVNAVSWYRLAARHGHQGSRVALANLKEPIPPADLVKQVREPTPEEFAAQMELAGQLGSAIGMLIGGRRK